MEMKGAGGRERRSAFAVTKPGVLALPPPLVRRHRLSLSLSLPARSPSRPFLSLGCMRFKQSTCCSGARREATR